MKLTIFVFFFWTLSPAVKYDLMFILVPFLARTLHPFFLISFQSVFLGLLAAPATEFCVFFKNVFVTTILVFFNYNFICHGNGDVFLFFFSFPFIYNSERVLLSICWCYITWCCKSKWCSARKEAKLMNCGISATGHFRAVSELGICHCRFFI